MIQILNTTNRLILLLNLILQTCNQGLISKINLCFVNEETGGVPCPRKCLKKLTQNCFFLQ